jgi:mono/diheme cytochrome c family protein
MTKRLLFLNFVLLLGLLAGACSKAPESTARLPDPAGESASQAGEMIFQTRCFVCHGRAGKGDGPASAGLGATVRDLTSPAWQESTSDETILKVIRSGAAAVGGTGAMTANPDLSDAQIHSLMLYIRSLRGK